MVIGWNRQFDVTWRISSSSPSLFLHLPQRLRFLRRQRSTGHGGRNDAKRRREAGLELSGMGWDWDGPMVHIWGKPTVAHKKLSAVALPTAIFPWTKYAILTNLILTSPFLQRRGPLHPSRCVARCQAFATAPLEALGNHPLDGPEGLTGLHQGSFAAILGGGASPTDCLSCFIIVSARSNIFYLFHI